MARGTVVHTHKVQPFSPPGAEGVYVSRMLLDEANSGSRRLQLNHGVVKAGQKLGGAAHPEPYDEIYYVIRGHARLNLDGVDHELEPGSAVFIPAGTFHALANESDKEDVEIITVWPGTPAPGGNEVYDARRQAWGTSYREVEESCGPADSHYSR